MNAEVISKVLKITKLALLINPSITTRAETGSKPTVFLEFYGNCDALMISICTNGWSRMEEQNEQDERENYDIYSLSENPEELDRAIERLTEIYQEYKGGEDNDIV